jgi:hypothetical protein
VGKEEEEEVDEEREIRIRKGKVEMEYLRSCYNFVAN